MTASASRSVGDLTSPEISCRLKASSVLLLPLGAMEQHGPHLPLNTDVVVAEGVSRRIVAQWGERFDLWQLPTLALGLSREHDWAAGTLSLSVQTFAALLRDMACTLVRALPARNLAIVNGHGGNRGILENLLHEFSGDFCLNCCVLHPFDLAQMESSPQNADVHGGRAETSVMLALAPDLVRKDLIAARKDAPNAAALHARIFDRGATFPWRSDDARIARDGIIGDAHDASAQLGEEIIARIVTRARDVLVTLLEDQKCQ
jgi:creatinine amidohydrolase